MSLSHIIILGIVLVIAVPPEKLPELMKNLGRLLNDLRRNTSGVWDEIKKDASVEPISFYNTNTQNSPSPNTPVVTPVVETTPEVTEKKKIQKMTQTPNQDPVEERNMSLIEHLTDLRVCLTKSAYAILLGTVAAWTISQQVFDIIRAPIAPYLPNGGLVYTGPIDKFMAHVKISLIVGMILSAPFWLYQIWKFISPALYQKEKRFAVGFIAFGTMQFLMGIAFSYYIVLPMAFKFLMHFGGDIDKPMITIDQYLGFFTHTALVFGLTFEMPVIITFLGMMGLISKKFLKEKRKYAVVAITAVSAIAAPPDALSMVLLMIPLWIMYEISIVLVGFFEKGKVESV